MMSSNNKGRASGTGNRKSDRDHLFTDLNPNNMMSNAQRVLSSAVNVLEEEIAAGILAAKKIEGKIIDVDDIREDPQDLMNRIRRDIHEAVDLLMDSVTAMTRHLGAFSDSILNTQAADKEQKTAGQKKSSSDIPVIKASKPVKAGNMAILNIALSNDRHPEPVTIAFQKTDLRGKAHSVIAARSISIKPASVTLSPGEEKTIGLYIRVPKSAAPGVYSALFVDVNDSDNRLIIHLDVN